MAFAVLLLSFPFTWLTIPLDPTAHRYQMLLLSSSKPEDIEDLIRQTPMSVISLYSALFILIAFCVKMRIAAILKASEPREQTPRHGQSQSRAKSSEKSMARGGGRGDYHHARLAEV